MFSRCRNLCLGIVTLRNVMLRVFVLNMQHATDLFVTESYATDVYTTGRYTILRYIIILYIILRYGLLRKRICALRTYAT
jgi:hypothetical protein